MKKLVILLSVIISLISCSDLYTRARITEAHIDNDSIDCGVSVNKVVLKNNGHYCMPATIYSTEYSGHKYIIFMSSPGSIFVIHDPDCKCNNK